MNKILVAGNQHPITAGRTIHGLRGAETRVIGSCAQTSMQREAMPKSRS